MNTSCWRTILCAVAISAMTCASDALATEGSNSNRNLDEYDIHGYFDGDGGVGWADGAFSARGAAVLITEFMASNYSTLTDEDGEYSDWVEIYNSNGSSVDLEGWYLTDDAGDLTKWQFPNVALGPHEFMVVFASGKDRTDPASPLHTNFKLATEGEYLGLVEADGVAIAHEYVPEYAEQFQDTSYGLEQNATTFLSSGTLASYLVPIDDTWIDTWMQVGFDDSGWGVRPIGMGFGDFWEDQLSVRASSELTTPPWTRIAEHMIDGSGLDINGPGTHAATTDGDMWLSDGNWTGGGPVNEQYAIFDLGDVYDVQSVRIWNYNEGGWTHRSVQEMDILVSIDDVAYTNLGTFGLTEAPGLDTVDFSETFTLTADDVRYVKFDIEDNYGLDPAGDDFVGLSEVIFDQTSVLQQEMQGVNASVWMRIEFEVDGDDLGLFEVLILRMKYEDGFVAYLNGTEVVGRNAPLPPQWDSTSLSDRALADALLFDHIDITAFLSELQAGTNVLALHGLNDAPGDAEFLILPELIAISDRRVLQYFPTPTPGEFNVAGAIGLVESVEFSIPRGLYDPSFQLTLSTATNGADVRYTLDGSRPVGTNGAVYDAPLTIDQTTVVCATAVKPDWVDAPLVANTYVFPADVINQTDQAPPGAHWDTEVDPEVVGAGAPYHDVFPDALASIPTVSLALDDEDIFGPDGIYANATQYGVAWERPVSVEYFDPDTGAEFQVNAGLRVHGGASRQDTDPKHSLRLLFKGIYGPTKLEFPLFGGSAVERFDTLVLRAGFGDVWTWPPEFGLDNLAQYATYFNDQWARETQAAMGHAASHGKFVHLYINGLYWGLHNLVERPDASFNAEHRGGDKEEYDVIHDFEVQEGDRVAWDTMMGLAEAGLADDASYTAIQEYLEPEPFMDYMILNIYAGNWDWPYHNWYAARSRVDPDIKFEFFVWDAEQILENQSIPAWGGTGTVNFDVHDLETMTWADNPGYLYTELRENADFRRDFADRVHYYFFNGGLLTPDSSAQRFTALRNHLMTAIVGESARWGDAHEDGYFTTYTRDDHWLPDVDLTINNYLPQRTDIVLDQFREIDLYPETEAPAFYINGSHQHGGAVLAGDGLSMATSNGSGAIWYSLDGSDPWLAGASRDILVTEDAAKHVLIPTGPVSDAWKGGQSFDDSGWNDYTFVPDMPGGVGYENGAGYEGYISYDVAAMHGVNGTCYVRIPFNIDGGDLAEFNYLALRVFYDDAFVAYLNGQEVLRSELVPADPAWNSEATGPRPVDPTAFEDFDLSAYLGQLQAGDNILALHALNGPKTSSDLLLSVKLIAGDDSVAPSAIEYTTPITLTDDTQVRARTLAGNEWSALNDATFTVGSVTLFINEFMADNETTIEDPDEPGEYPDWVELYNPAPIGVDLGGMYLTDDLGDPTKWQIPSGVSISAGGVLLFWADDDVEQGDTHTNFKLGKDGEEIGLFDTDANGNVALDTLTFGAQGEDVSMGRFPDGAECWRFFATSTPEASNGGLHDYEPDGDVDLLDYMEFPVCLTGPTGVASVGCLVFDSDCDGDVDLADFASLQSVFGEF